MHSFEKNLEMYLNHFKLRQRKVSILDRADHSSMFGGGGLRIKKGEKGIAMD